MFEEILAEWDGERVVIGRDGPSEAWMFACIHSTVLGPALGGTRMRVYATPAEALAEGLGLAAAMTAKNALAGVPFGGGKAVLAVDTLPDGAARAALFRRYGDFVGSLRGQFLTGPDVNTGCEDMDVMFERTPYVFCRTEAHGGSGSSSRSTASGVYHGIRAGLAHVFGAADVVGRTILVQGAGSVGAQLVRLLTEAGARVLVSDVEPARVREAVEHFGATPVDAASAAETPCDVYAPCALGGTLDERSIRHLQCSIVAGAANNQLGCQDAADRLRNAGILYVPDFVVNAGGVIHGVGRETLGWTPEAVATRIAAIAQTLSGIFADADRHGTSTEAAATALVRARLSRGRPAA